MLFLIIYYVHQYLVIHFLFLQSFNNAFIHSFIRLLIHPTTIHQTIIHPPTIYPTTIHSTTIHPTIIHPTIIHPTPTHPPTQPFIFFTWIGWRWDRMLIIIVVYLESLFFHNIRCHGNVTRPLRGPAGSCTVMVNNTDYFKIIFKSLSFTFVFLF